MHWGEYRHEDVKKINEFFEGNKNASNNFKKMERIKTNELKLMIRKLRISTEKSTTSISQVLAFT